MRFKAFLETVYGDVDELFLNGKAVDDIDESDYIIAYGSDIWIVNDENFQEFNDSLFKKLKVAIVDQTDNLSDFVERLTEEFPDVIVARKIDGNSLLLVTNELRHSSASTTLLKLMNYLKVDTVEVTNNYANREEDETLLQWKEDLKSISKDTIFYHGTTKEYFENMMKTGGIVPRPDKTNFGKIKHSDKVFVTLNIEKALFHAVTASQKTQGVPLIIALKVPDISKLVPDYDVSLMLGKTKHNEPVTLGYSDIAKRAKASDQTNKLLNKRLKKSGEDLNKKLGIFGYTGRIPVSMFKRVSFDFTAALKKNVNDKYDFDETLEPPYDGYKQWYYFTVNSLEDLKAKYQEALKDIEDRTKVYYGIEDEEDTEEDN